MTPHGRPAAAKIDGHEVGDGRLAGRAGHADDGEPARRVAPERGRHRAERRRARRPPRAGGRRGAARGRPAARLRPRATAARPPGRGRRPALPRTQQNSAPPVSGARVVHHRDEVGVAVGPGDPGRDALDGVGEVAEPHPYPPGAPGCASRRRPAGGAASGRRGRGAARPRRWSVRASWRRRGRRGDGGGGGRVGGRAGWARTRPSSAGMASGARGAAGAGATPIVRARVAADVGERRRRHLGGVGRRRRLVDDHDDRQLGDRRRAGTRRRSRCSRSRPRHCR